jgi:hypothetical protein
LKDPSSNPHSKNLPKQGLNDETLTNFIKQSTQHKRKRETKKDVPSPSQSEKI